MTNKPKTSAETQEYATRGGGAIGTFTVISSVIASLMLLASSRQQNTPLPPQQPTKPAKMPDPLAPHRVRPHALPASNSNDWIHDIDPESIRDLRETIEEIERQREQERQRMFHQLLEEEMQRIEAMERAMTI